MPMLIYQVEPTPQGLTQNRTNLRKSAPGNDSGRRRRTTWPTGRCGKAVKMMSKIERHPRWIATRTKHAKYWTANFLLFIFFQLMVSVSKSAEDKMLFVTQFAFYQMVLFVPAANKGKVTQGKTLRVSFTYLVEFCTIVALVGVMWEICIMQQFYCLLLFITSAEREVKDSRRSGMYQSWHFWDKIGHPKSEGFRFYSAI